MGVEHSGAELKAGQTAGDGTAGVVGGVQHGGAAAGADDPEHVRIAGSQQGIRTCHGRQLRCDVEAAEGAGRVQLEAMIRSWAIGCEGADERMGVILSLGRWAAGSRTGMPSHQLIRMAE
jgi:hypothetical protein